MSGKPICAIIGKGFGDEGKGLAVNHFSSKVPGTVVIKHNGGAQAGHTVEPEGKRFVFHQLSAGSFCNADTFWADSYYPDLYKLGEEIDEFRSVSGMCPKIFCDMETNVTLIDDVLINMLLELSRGEGRHGSCGMGINECDLRTGAGFGITVKELLSSSAESVVKRVNDIRESYGKQRLSELGLGRQSVISPEMTEMFDTLSSKTVIENAVEEMMLNADKYVNLCDDTGRFLNSREQIIFESGQGLLLDSENTEYAPHVTASRTGLFHPCRILSKYGMKLSEAVYVTRSYVTRHGAGSLPYECSASELGITSPDETNVHNSWQGSIRYARHGSADEFIKPVLADTGENGAGGVRASLFITHLNETDGKLLTCAGDIPVAEFIDDLAIKNVFSSFYFSYSKNSAE
ncbi:MAG: adenylosuccinate synthetase [Lachnospiraceae bacterium]|nr:adenylosuccinate synthetase [Lachnospiraceae bacterium]